MTTNTTKDTLEAHFLLVKAHLIQALHGVSVGLVSTDIKFQDRPNLVMEGNSIDGFLFEHILAVRLRSDHIEIELPLILKVKQSCLLDFSNKEISNLDVINSFGGIGINHDLYDEGGFSVTLFDSSLITLFNNALGCQSNKGFVKGEPLDFGRNLADKDTLDYLFFERLAAEISATLKGEITPINFKLFTAFKTHSERGVDLAMSNAARLLAQMNH